MPVIETEWVQAGELGLAFIVVVLCSALVMFVMQSSTRRERELLQIIMKVTPLMESMSTAMDGINAAMSQIGDRLKNIEDTQMGFMPRAECGNIVVQRRRASDKVVPRKR
jgi:hypothetical protein